MTMFLKRIRIENNRTTIITTTTTTTTGRWTQSLLGSDKLKL